MKRILLIFATIILLIGIYFGIYRSIRLSSIHSGDNNNYSLFIVGIEFPWNNTTNNIISFVYAPLIYRDAQKISVETTEGTIQTIKQSTRELVLDREGGLGIVMLIPDKMLKEVERYPLGSLVSVTYGFCPDKDSLFNKKHELRSLHLIPQI